MTLRRSFIFLLLSLSLTASYSQSKKSKTKSSPQLFSIGETPVNADEFIYLYSKNHTDKTKDYTREKIDEYLDLFINFKLKVAEARSRGIDTTAAFKIEYNSYRDELRKPYLPDARIIDSLVKLTYDRMKEEVRVAHILITVKPDATPADTLAAYTRIMELRKKILAGEDFGALAAKVSEDPSARTNKGDLGYFTAMQMVFPFETAAYTTPVGQVSQPVRTRFGYHIIKVIDRQPSRGEVEVSHIMLRTTGNEMEDIQVRNKIFEIYDEAKAGVSWEELCEQYSEDLNTKKNGGKLRPFGVGVMNGIPEFERVAFSLQDEHEISDPFQTSYGWHIVRLEKKIPLAPFSELEPSLKSRVSRDERVQLSKEHTAAKLRKDYDYVENPSAKSKLSERADSTLTRGSWTIILTESEKASTLFSLLKKKSMKTYTVQDFMNYIKQHARTSSLSPQNYFYQLYDGFVDAMILNLMEQTIMQQNPSYKMLLNEYYEGILLFDIMEKEVWSKASADSIGQHEYYQRHASTYQAGEQVRAELYTATSAEQLDQLKALVQKGDPEGLRTFVTTNNIRTESGNYEKRDRPVFSVVPWAIGVHAAEKDGKYYLAKISEILAPGPKTFDEARAAVISDYQHELEEQWLAQLKQKYPVKVNEKGKEYVYSALQH